MLNPPVRSSQRAAFVALWITCLVCGLGACSAPKSTPPRTDADPSAEGLAADSSAIPAPEPAADTLARPTSYTRVKVLHSQHVRALIDSLGADHWTQVLKLNRVDLAHVRDRDSLILPDVFGDSLDLAPFPRTLAAVRDTAKLLLVSLRLQAFAAYDSGQLVQWGPTSTGRKSKPTPAGLYHATWKDRDRISTVDDEWRLFWCVNIDNHEGVSLHQYELPGRPASHSCVRLLESDAMWVYGWAEQWKLSAGGRLAATGTPVVVFGAWAWGKRAPWKHLPEHPAVGQIDKEEVEDALRVLREADRPVFTPTP